MGPFAPDDFLSRDMNNILQPASALDLTDKSKQYVVFVDAASIDRQLLESLPEDTFGPVKLIVLLNPPLGKSVADCVFAQDYSEYRDALTERERCAKVAEESSMENPAGPRSYALKLSAQQIAAKIRSGE